MAEEVTLAYPNYSEPFQIHPDACGYGLGAVVLQKINGEERPIAYASERNYSITEKECLAMIWALEKFRSYVWGNPILAVTDHHALCWLLTKRELAGRLAR